MVIGGQGRDKNDRHVLFQTQRSADLDSAFITKHDIQQNKIDALGRNLFANFSLGRCWQ